MELSKTIGKGIIVYTRINGKSLLMSKPVKVNIKNLKLATENFERYLPKLKGSIYTSFHSKWEPMTLSPRIVKGRKNTKYSMNETAASDYYGKPCLYINKIVSQENGYGTQAIKEVVKESLNKTDGHVALSAELISSEKGHPLGFYYKLGFRSFQDRYNKLCEQWLESGGKGTVPGLSIGACVNMYLPKENITHCLNYPQKLSLLG